MSRRLSRIQNLALGALTAAVCVASPSSAANTRVVTWGDSITFGYYDGSSAGNDCSTGAPSNNAPEQCGYPGRLGSRLDDPTKFSPVYDVEILNLGRGGEKTGNGSPNALSRIDIQAGVTPVCPCQDLEDPCKINSLRYWVCNGTVQPADLFVLMEGTNDISNGISVETTRYNLGLLGAKAEWVGMNVVISSITPRHKFACVDSDNTTAQSLNSEIAGLALEMGWPQADPYSLMKALTALYNTYYQDWEAMKCDPDNETGVGDPVGHPNAKGFDEISWSKSSGGNYSKSFESVVRRALPPRLILTVPTPPLTSGVSLPFSVTLPDVATFAQTVELTWDFGDGTIVTQSVSTSPVAQNHTFWYAGDVTVTVTAEHANGGQRQVTALLQLAAGTTIFVDGFESGSSSNWIVGTN